MYRQVPYGISSTSLSRELHGHTTALATTAEVDSDIPVLIEDEDYQWLYDKKKAIKLASPLKIMCRIEEIEECFARKGHKLTARQPSATPTTDASPLPLPKFAESCRSRKQERRHCQCPPTKDYRRPAASRSLLPFPRRRSTASQDETSVSQGLLGVEVGAVPGRRAAGSSTTSAGSSYWTSRSRRSALHRHRAERAALLQRWQRRPCQE